MSFGRTLWMVKGKYESEDIFLLNYIKGTRADVISAIMDKARQEKFIGSIDDRLKELGWEIVQVVFFEIR